MNKSIKSVQIVYKKKLKLVGSNTCLKPLFSKLKIVQRINPYHAGCFFRFN